MSSAEAFELAKGIPGRQIDPREKESAVERETASPCLLIPYFFPFEKKILLLLVSNEAF